jgi:cellulose synthase/poly-beta-1,6-N-acetylglucosamine synthase-like glycosyltransferase
MMQSIFWLSLFFVFYAYFGYPVLLMLINRLSSGLNYRGKPFPDQLSVSMIIPVHNEEDVIASKLDNCAQLIFSGNLQFVLVSDGSTDNTSNIVHEYKGLGNITFLELKERKGKANALNAGLGVATGDIVVFNDASIMLDPQAITEIVRPFVEDIVGCVSGEDIIEGGSGEGLYGRYELFLRRQESYSGSIVGASGSLYAQRRGIIDPFIEGVAPDFYSVLNTVEHGYRAISISESFGYMKAAESHKDEFNRKVRTFIRGITALFKKARLMNPFRYPRFSLYLVSHKLIRWLVPFFLLAALISNLALLDLAFFRVLLFLQLVFYATAAIGAYHEPVANRWPVVKIPLFFVAVNLSILKAWYKYLGGTRQEIWTPTKRS